MYYRYSSYDFSLLKNSEPQKLAPPPCGTVVTLVKFWKTPHVISPLKMGLLPLTVHWPCLFYHCSHPKSFTQFSPCVNEATLLIPVQVLLF